MSPKPRALVAVRTIGDRWEARALGDSPARASSTSGAELAAYQVGRKLFGVISVDVHHVVHAGGASVFLVSTRDEPGWSSTRGTPP